MDSDIITTCTIMNFENYVTNSDKYLVKFCLFSVIKAIMQAKLLQEGKI